MNIDYSRFYRGTEPLKTYGHAGNKPETGYDLCGDKDRK